MKNVHITETETQGDYGPRMGKHQPVCSLTNLMFLFQPSFDLSGNKGGTREKEERWSVFPSLMFTSFPPSYRFSSLSSVFSKPCLLVPCLLWPSRLLDMIFLKVLHFFLFFFFPPITLRKANGKKNSDEHLLNLNLFFLKISTN
jgi:hypothetical protein